MRRAFLTGQYIDKVYIKIACRKHVLQYKSLPIRHIDYLALGTEIGIYKPLRALIQLLKKGHILLSDLTRLGI